MSEFEKKVIVVTGAAKGIGKAIADNFLRHGAKVAICDMDKEALDKAAAEGFLAYAADVSDEAAVNEFVAKVKKEYGKIDVLVNNAGIYPQFKLMDMDSKLFSKTFDINAKSVFLMTKAVAEVMKQTNTGGAIINAASFAAVLGSVGSGAYAATKSAVFSMTKCFAAELAPFGIRVNGYIPGVIKTQMTIPLLEKNGEAMLSQIALKKAGEPQDIANAVEFLASGKASYITGTLLEISGGKLCVQNPAAAW